MRRPQNQTAIVFAIQALVLALVLTIGSASVAYADQAVLEPSRHVRVSDPGRATMSPSAPTGDEQSPLPTPVKQRRSPRVPPVFSPLDGAAGTFLKLWMGAQSAWQAVAERVQAQ